MNYKSIICFAKNTKVATPGGNLLIQDVRPGDDILSFNEEKQSTEVAQVLKIGQSNHSKIVRLTLDDLSIIEMTPDHPIWIFNKGWSSIENNDRYDVKTEKLEEGDMCLKLGANNEFSYNKVNSIEFLTGNFRMYIVSGGNYNNFFANGVLVHDENLLHLKIKKEEAYVEELQAG